MAGGAGATTPVEDSIKETVYTHLGLKARAKAKEKAKEIVTIAVRPGITRGSVRASKRARAKAKVSTENVTTAGKRNTLQESARRAKMGESLKGKGEGYKGRGKGSWSWGKGIWNVDGDELQGEWE